MINAPLHRMLLVSSSAAVTAIPANVYAILLVGGSAATTLKLTNDADGNGTTVISAAAAVGTTVFIDLSALGPIAFSSKCYATIAGTAGVAYIWYD